MNELIKNWLSEENLNKAKGKTREAIFLEFGNTLEPIAYINPVYLPYLGNSITDNRVYSGKGYFINHAVNHHPEVKVEDYDIQATLDNPDIVYYDDRDNNNSLLFVKKKGRNFIEVVSLDIESEHLVVHKTYFYSKKNNPYKNLTPVRTKPSLIVGKSANAKGSIISPTE